MNPKNCMPAIKFDGIFSVAVCYETQIMKKCDISVISYVLFFKRNSQNSPDKKKINDIIKYNSGNGISPADRKLLLFASSISI